MTMNYQDDDRTKVENQSWYQFYGQQMKAANQSGWHPQPDPGEGVILTLKQAEELQSRLEEEAAKANVPAESECCKHTESAVPAATTSGSYVSALSYGSNAAFASMNSAAGASYPSSGTGASYASCGNAGCHNSGTGSAVSGFAFTTSGSAVYPWQFAAGSGAYPWQFASSGSAAYPWKYTTSGSGSSPVTGSGSGILGYGIYLI